MILAVVTQPAPAKAGQRILDVSGFTEPVPAQKSGQTVTILRFDDQGLLAALEKDPGTKKVTVKSQKYSDSVVAVMPYNLVRGLANRGVHFELSTPAGSFSLPAADTDMEKIVQEWGIEPGLSELELTVTGGSAEDVSQFKRACEAKGWTGITGPVVFSAEVVAGNRRTEITVFPDYVSRSLALDREYDPNIMAGVFRNKEGEYLPVPARIRKENGRTLAVLKYRDNGLFAVVENRKSFMDVRTHWGKYDINTLAAKMIVSGTTENSYSPHDKVTRAQLAAITARALGLSGGANTGRFSDAGSGDWFMDAVRAVTDAGILTGYPEGTFRPGAHVTREEIAVTVVRILRAVDKNAFPEPVITGDYLARFTDSDRVSPWARAYMATAVRENIINGDSRGCLNPEKKSTRAETAAIIRKTLVRAGLFPPDFEITVPEEGFQTNKGSLEVSGRVESGCQIAVNNNSAPVDREGRFKATVVLSTGENKINISSVYPAGDIASTMRTVVFDATAPGFSVNTPRDNYLTKEAFLMVSGTVESGGFVEVNGVMAQIDPKGYFDHEVGLNTGKNTIKVTASDKAGNKTAITRTVIYDHQPPLLTVTSPDDNSETGYGMVIVTGYTEPDSTVWVNGSSVAVDGDGNFSKVVDLKVEKNSVIIKAFDPAGNETVVERRVVYENNRIKIKLPEHIKIGPIVRIQHIISVDGYVTSKVLTESGSHVRTLQDNVFRQAGTFSPYWDGTGESGNPVSDGRFKFVAELRDKDGLLLGSSSAFVIAARVPELAGPGKNGEPVVLLAGDRHRIEYAVSGQALVTVRVNRGNFRIKTLSSGEFKTSGNYSAEWDGKEESGAVVSDGTYTYVIEAVSPTIPSFSHRHQGTFLIEKQVPAVSGFAISPELFRIGGYGMSIRYALSEDAVVSLKVLGQGGKTVSVLLDRVSQNAGSNYHFWNGKQANGKNLEPGLYTVELRAVDNSGKESMKYVLQFTAESDPVSISSIRPDSVVVAATAVIAQMMSSLPEIINPGVSPSPFNPSEPGSPQAEVKYYLTADGVVDLKIMNSRGYPVNNLLSAQSQAGGLNLVRWDGKDQQGNTVSDGRYTLQITARSLQGGSYRSMAQAGIIVESSVPQVNKLSIAPDPLMIGDTTANIRYSLSEDAEVTVVIADREGHIVRTVIQDEMQYSGSNFASWDGKDTEGRYISEGEYTVRINAVDLYDKHSTEAVKAFSAGFMQGINNVTVSPNPFNPDDPSNKTARIRFSLANESLVTIEILNSRYSAIKQLSGTERKNKGYHEVAWDGRNDKGEVAGDGAYYLRITAESAEVKRFKSHVDYAITIEKRAPLISGLRLNPNPFRLTREENVFIRYYLSENADVSISIYSGNTLVRSIVNSQAQMAGQNFVFWDGKDVTGSYAGQGIHRVVVRAVDQAGKSGEISGSVTFYPRLWIVSSEPGYDSSGIAVDTKIEISFTDTVRKGETFEDITLKVEDRNIQFTSKLVNDKFIMTPSTDLAYGTLYTVTIPAGTLYDISGKKLESPYHLSFTTEAIPRNIDGTIVNLSDTVISEFTQADGESVTVVTLAESEALEKVKRFSLIRTAIIPVTISSDLVEARLTGPLIKALADRKALITIKSVQASLSVQATEIDLEGLARKLTADSGKLTVIFKLGKTGWNDTKIITDMAQEQSLSVLFGPFRFEVLGKFGDRETDIKTFKRHVTIGLEMPRTVEPAQVAGVTPRGGNLVPVPSRTGFGGSGQTVELKTVSSGLYAVVKGPSGFKDIKNHWAKGDIDSLAAGLIVGGMGQGLFAPEQKVTRAQYVTMIVRALGLESLNTNPAQQFRDVKPGVWYAGTTAQAVALGIIIGYPDGNFRPNASIKREEAAAIAARVLELTRREANASLGDPDSILGFRDKSRITPWARVLTATAVKYGLIRGYPNGLFAPASGITRGEAAVIVRKILYAVFENTPF